ncbi:alcohol acetyltransferase [Irpex rosettiformis]|uniref:Alcohol acetyltransferase n=1 Tax=Irpex rosettiformis TaxID=378272 RepID=A0ACB8TPT2_9APHY|nr:alcohol acetyltransferase [Irpex rosettiformis]
MSTSTESLERVRNAGLMERYHISLTELGFDTCVVAPATYSSSHPAVSLDRSTVLRALKRVVLAHPALFVQHGGKHDKKPYFTRLPQVDLNDVLTYATDLTASIEEIVNAELQKPFSRSTTKPLWRVTVRTDNVVVFAWHHSIGDGGCAQSFHAAFLTALNTKSGAEETDESTVVAAPDKLVIAPAIEERTNISVSFKTACGTLYGSFAPLAFQPLRKAWTANPISKEPHLQIETRIRMIDPNTSRELVALCREKKSTLTGFMHTLALFVLSHHLAVLEKETPGKKQKYKTFSTVVPISLRRFTGTSPLDLCDQVTIYHTFPKITRDIPQFPPTKETFPWQTASDYATSLHANFKKSCEVIGTINFIYRLGISKSYFLDHLGQKRETTLVLSNIGAMPKLKDLGEKQRDDGALWQFDNVGFGQNDNVISSAIKLNMAGSPSGAISAVYNWGQNNIDTGLVEAVIADIHNSISTILAE